MNPSRCSCHRLFYKYGDSSQPFRGSAQQLSASCAQVPCRVRLFLTGDASLCDRCLAHRSGMENAQTMHWSKLWRGASRSCTRPTTQSPWPSPNSSCTCSSWWPCARHSSPVACRRPRPVCASQLRWRGQDELAVVHAIARSGVPHAGKSGRTLGTFCT
jgi:hypothetical protein